MADLHAEGEAALAALDRALAGKPRLDGPDFTAATEHLCLMRDMVVARCRRGEDCGALLDGINALISCSLSGHFPLGKLRWPLILSARDSLQTLLCTLHRPGSVDGTHRSK